MPCTLGASCSLLLVACKMMTSIEGIQICEDELEVVLRVEGAMRVHEVGAVDAMDMSHFAHRLEHPGSRGGQHSLCTPATNIRYCTSE